MRLSDQEVPGAIEAKVGLSKFYSTLFIKVSYQYLRSKNCCEKDHFRRINLFEMFGFTTI